jgi:DNA-binding CsgD family transcriptional regulator
MTRITPSSSPRVSDPVEERKKGRLAGRTSSIKKEQRDEAPDRLAPIRDCAEVDVLDRLGVPYLVVEADGEPLIVSRRLSELFTVEADVQAVIQQSRRLALSVRKRRAMASAPSCRGEMQLTGHLLALSRRERVVLVVLSPSKRAAVARTALDATALTAREREVAVLLSQGRSSKEIGDELGISTHTARHHTERILTKLGVRSRAEAAAVIGRFAIGSEGLPDAGDGG